MSEILLEAKGLSKDFPAGGGRKIHAVSDVSLRVYRGETLGLVGESGCGKSTLGRLLVRLLESSAGDLFLSGENVTAMKEKEFRRYRRQFQMIFQDPYASLNPRMTVRDIIAEPLKTWHICPSKEETTKKVLELMEAVGVPGEFLLQYPHQFSGGQRQRISIARAIAMDPALIVCDEPVSALDVSVQNQVLNLLNRLKKERGLTYLFISHDLSVVRHISDRVCVMFLGRIFEVARTEDLFSHPLHPYARFLMNAIPVPDPHRRDDNKQILTGEPPSPVNPPSGCCFHTRCPYASEKCRTEMPVLRDMGGREVACHYPGIADEGYAQPGHGTHPVPGAQPAIGAQQAPDPVQEDRKE